MGRSKPSIDESELAELLQLKEDVLTNREDTTGLREEVDLLRKEVCLTNAKQDDMNIVLSTVQKAVFALSDQLTTITDVLKNLGAQGASSSAQPTARVTEQQGGRTDPPPIVQTTIENPMESVEQGQRLLTEELRKRLLLEQEKTRQYTLFSASRLPPIQIGQK
ncbi:hypothetical protein VPH35_086248 [Triticum aestivum]